MNRIRIMNELKRAAVNDEKFYNIYLRMVTMEINDYDYFDEIMNGLEKMNFYTVRELKAFFEKCHGIYDIYTHATMGLN